jgi:hypothetical protein
VQALIEPLADRREAQHRQFQLDHDMPLTDALADHAIMSMYRQGVIGVQAIAHVHQQWQEPTCDWDAKTGYRLFNAATHALTGRMAERPRVTADLHQIIDGVCEHVS